MRAPGAGQDAHPSEGQSLSALQRAEPHAMADRITCQMGRPEVHPPQQTQTGLLFEKKAPT